MSASARSSLDPSKRSVPNRFESFDLLIERIDEIYRVVVTKSPRGRPSPEKIDPTGLSGGTFSSKVGDEVTRDVRRRPVDRNDFQRLGEKLFRAVFVGAIETAFRTSIEYTQNHKVGLRVCLHLSRAPELATLPWEALWDPDGRIFLADQPNLTIVRTLDVSAEVPMLTPAAPPLKVLALLPQPKGERDLKGAAEWQEIQKHLEPLVESGEVKTERVEPPTLKQLSQRLDQEPCQVLHVVAHGGPGGQKAGGQLILEDKSGEADVVSGTELARAFEHRTVPPRLVVLSACYGARAAIDDLFDGMAQHFLQRGVPAVVAMRTAITDPAAVAFAAALYRELAQGRSIEASMAEARRVLSLSEHRKEWATPALYLRGENVRILDAHTVTDAMLGPPPRASRVRYTAPATAVVAAVAIGLLGVWWSRLGTPELSQPVPLLGSAEANEEVATLATVCPPPVGFQDLGFVRIEPDVIDLGDRKIIVDEAFCIGTKEVSRRDWLTAMGGELPRAEWPHEWPMTVATLEEAIPFLERLESRDPGVTYRLPTADEWELAARAGQTTDYFFGDDPADLDRYGNCRNVLGRDGYDGPAPVGSFLPNGLGLHDVHGNVAEWVQWPKDSEALADDDQGIALRLGGSHDTQNCTFDVRSQVKPDAGRFSTGFRVVRELTASQAR